MASLSIHLTKAIYLWSIAINNASALSKDAVRVVMKDNMSDNLCLFVLNMEMTNI